MTGEHRFKIPGFIKAEKEAMKRAAAIKIK
jgi:hypothetical protein